MPEILKDPGVGYNTKSNAQKIIEHGKTNVKHINRSKTIDDLYTKLIELSWPVFIGIVVLGYILVNCFFATLYFFTSVQEFDVSGSLWNQWLQLFYFSAQTVTTLGYGYMSPTGNISGAISTIEAFLGLLSFSFITGLLYGRFSKPKAKVQFSEHIIFRNFEEEKALMFRVMNKRKNMMIEPELKATMSITTQENGVFKRNFFELKLNRNKILFLPTIWTLVHKINEESPLFKYNEEELAHLDFEIYILFQYHEEAFNQNLYQMHSYDYSQLKFGYKFEKSYEYDQDGFMVLDHDKFNKIIKE